ncbi:Cytochrome P450, E-class, group I [Trema orientale]|uniref:Cytochrome P450, E-class, group I n=1 Tax=Trema orientale TaxID=63057 RepID=A0A2P5FLA2_TREOI|nr:Cytochrome P450, E-class, group I [Trema orientale]
MEYYLVPTTVLSLSIVLVSILITTWAWKVLNWVWLRPNQIESCLRRQGLRGNSYRILFGDSKESSMATSRAESKTLNLLSDAVAPRVLPFIHRTVEKYGENSFVWVGPIARGNIMNTEYLREIFTKIDVFQKPEANPFIKTLITGLIMHNGEKWVKHRRILNAAFNLEKLKHMLPAIYASCCEMIISKWEKLVSEEGSCEVDACTYFDNLTADVISRTVFGSNYEEGRKLFQLQEELVKLSIKASDIVNIPGWRLLRTKPNKKLKEVNGEIDTLLKNMINKKEKAIRAGEAAVDDDLLSILLESNFKEIEEHGNKKDVGMSIKDIIEECKVFYFAGRETTSSLLVWTIVLLSRHPNWQARAREEVLQVFGANNIPDYDGLQRLKVVTMILHEVLRLYPPATTVDRTVQKKTQLGELSLPAGAQVELPITLVHHDTKLWGDNANEFRPERFADGISKATNGRVAFLPFGWGPRICIGQNLAMIQAKLVLSMILQRFDFELSPSYTHAPCRAISLRPQYGAPFVIHKHLY